MFQRLFVGAVVVALGVLPAQAAPITITNVTVGIGAMGCMAQSNCAFNYTSAGVGWFTGGGVTLTPGQDLILAQSFQGTPNQSTSFNFDTSDGAGLLNFPQVAITVNGVTTMFTDGDQILNTSGRDFNPSNPDNEAQNFGAPLIGPGYMVFFGYADNVHTSACGNWATSVGLNGSSTCFPAGFFAATVLQARGGVLPDIPVPSQGLPNHCLGIVSTCYESGVIRIVATDPPVPEPATLTLFALGLAGAGRRYWRQRRAS